MADEDWELRMFPDLRNKWNDLSVVAGLSMVTSSRYRIYYSKDVQSIYFSQNDFLIGSPKSILMSNKFISRDSKSNWAVKKSVALTFLT